MNIYVSGRGNNKYKYKYKYQHVTYRENHGQSRGQEGLAPGATEMTPSERNLTIRQMQYRLPTKEPLQIK